MSASDWRSSFVPRTSGTATRAILGIPRFSAQARALVSAIGEHVREDQTFDRAIVESARAAITNMMTLLYGLRAIVPVPPATREALVLSANGA